MTAMTMANFASGGSASADHLAASPHSTENHASWQSCTALALIGFGFGVGKFYG
jgi:hypothetical protein